MTKTLLKSQQRQLMDRRSEDLRELFKGMLSDDSDTRKRVKDKLSRLLWQHPKIGMVVKGSFSQINFDDSDEFYNDSLGETFLKFDKIIAAFLRKNQITIHRLDDISEENLGNLFIRYFNGCHYHTACNLYRKLKQKGQVYGQIIVSLEQPKNDADGQEYKTVGEEIPDHKNLNDLDNFNLGDISPEAIDKLPIFGDSIDKLRNCSKKVDCFEILLLKCQGYTQAEIAERLGIHQSNISRNWKNKCLECINQIIAENE